MRQPHFLDPLGSRLPALEQNTLKLRAMQMMLVMFYAEELKRKVLDLIQATDGLAARLQPAGSRHERVPKGTKNPVDKALNALIDDGAIAPDEKVEIVSLIDYRNAIGHRMHELVADFSTERYVRDLFEYGSDRIKEFDYGAVERLQHFHRRIGSLYRTHHYVMTSSANKLMFKAAERTFLSEIKRLKRKICDLHAVRGEDIRAINAELSLTGTEFDSNERYPTHPLHKYDDGRLTQRGVEICYRLFDSGRSPMSVAHLMGISLRAARHHHKLWGAAGGKVRPQVDYESLPRRKFYRKYDD
ncbi:hypothetical protein [Pleomorphomonas carboxyditropha]|uniref:Uncharacterized protein n=1 Tax=Pleomorphomonas carboxyditropha TaxID=2023338 RepID=A0A2G9WYS1_9HYPH|nr:hypothetical protein [Pleomorphomonas carboxyditropha]PIO99442.1 hypothetical protein CJ014_08990 [Pleomorphomonas carboxyditropha]